MHSHPQAAGLGESQPSQMAKDKDKQPYTVSGCCHILRPSKELRLRQTSTISINTPPQYLYCVPKISTFPFPQYQVRPSCLNPPAHLHTKESNADPVCSRPFQICCRHVKGAATDMPATMFNRLRRSGGTSVARPFPRNHTAATTAVHIKGPEVRGEALTRGLIKLLQERVTKQALDRQKRVDESVAEVVRSPWDT